MIKSFFGQVLFCFAILRAISAYVGENGLSQYNYKSNEACKIKYACLIYGSFLHLTANKSLLGTNIKAW